MKPVNVYSLQNRAIHAARAQLEVAGILDPWSGLEQIRNMAGEINGGIQSVSRLSLEQRRLLIERLIEKGASVKNPILYPSDFKAEAARSGRKSNVLAFSRVTEKQLRMLDALASRVHWPRPDSCQRFCIKLFNAPRPRNRKEVDRLAAILRSMTKRQGSKARPDRGEDGRQEPA